MIDILVMLLFAAGVAAYMFPKFIKMYSTSKDFAKRILLIIGIATTAFVFIFSAGSLLAPLLNF